MFKYIQFRLLCGKSLELFILRKETLCPVMNNSHLLYPKPWCRKLSEVANSPDSDLARMTEALNFNASHFVRRLVNISLHKVATQIRSVAQLCPTVCDPWIAARQASLSITNSWSSLRLNVHQVSDAIQPSHPLSSPSPAPNPSQHQSLFQWVNSLHEVAKVLEFQL